MPLYLDNAATSYPKPPCVIEAVRRALVEIGSSPGRGSHRLAREASAIVARARQSAALLLGVEEPERILFTRNATESVNVVLKGWLRPGDRVLVSSMEHNAVVRPLGRLAASGIQLDFLRCGPSGLIDLDDLREKLSTPARLVAAAHASNVNGALQPAAQIAQLCEASSVPLLLDAAQTAGLQPIAAHAWRLGMLACSGHKALLGPPGVGILYIREDLDVLPLLEGGTGSLSEELEQPGYCPDRYESGTPNFPGIAGLAAGIDFLLERGVEAVLRHELALAAELESELAQLPGVQLYSPRVRGTGTVSFTVPGMNPGDIGHLLDEAFDIAVRTGLHCAPLAHRTLGSFPEGTVRVSPGYSTSRQDVEYFLRSLRSLLARRG